jgi:hypothetical protein
MKGRPRQMSWAGGKTGEGRRNGWCLMREGDVLTLSRRIPVRFDIRATADLPAAGRRISRARLAHQLRQDVWRCLRDLRGFWPAVRIERREDALRVTVGGALEGAQTSVARAPVAQAEARLDELLASPAHRARWLRHAGGAA